MDEFVLFILIWKYIISSCCHHCCSLPGQKRVGQLNVLDRRLFRVPLRLHGVRSGQHSGAGVQLADDSRLRKANRKAKSLLHFFFPQINARAQSSTRHTSRSPPNAPWRWRVSAAPWPRAAPSACCRSSCQIRQCSRCRCRSAPGRPSAGPAAWSPDPSSRRRWDPRRWSPSLTCTGRGAPGCRRTGAAETCWCRDLRRGGCWPRPGSGPGPSDWSLCVCRRTAAAGCPETEMEGKML